MIGSDRGQWRSRSGCSKAEVLNPIRCDKKGSRMGSMDQEAGSYVFEKGRSTSAKSAEAANRA